ncbi:MAG: tetratricopeptide repeat protein [Bacteroidia bacterium]|nr:tetratricopeptide repeat protein [Bacteroidia bacterium]
MKLFFTFFFIFLFHFLLFSQTQVQNDSNVVKSLIEQCNSNIQKNNKEAIKYGLQAVKAAENITDFRLKAKANQALSSAYNNGNDYKNTTLYMLAAAENFFRAKDTLAGLRCQNYAGYCNVCLGKFDKASDLLLASLKVSENKAYACILSNTYLMLGFLYRDMKNYDKAMYYFNKCYKDVPDKEQYLSDKYTALNEIGNMHLYLKDYSSAISYQLKSLKIKEEIRDTSSMGYSYNDIGNTYLMINKEDSAMYYLNKAYLNSVRNNNKTLEAVSLLNMGEIFYRKKEYNKGIETELKSLDIAKELNDAAIMKNIFYALGNFYKKINDFKNANYYLEQYIAYNDSIQGAETTKQITEIQEKYQSEKKEKEIEILQLDKIHKEKEIWQQKIIKYTLFGIIGLILLLVFVLYKAYRNKKKTSEILSEQKEEILEKNEELMQQKEEISVQRDEIENQKSIIEAKSIEVRDSIQYAKRIQDSILQPATQINEYFSDSFILYIPKDIVSGDFYLIKQIDNDNLKPETRNQKLLIAAADCTGHGVPGGFMCMIGVDKLQEAAEKSDMPSEILMLLNKGIKSVLHQSDRCSASRDGMDIVLCRIDCIFSGEAEIPPKYKILAAGANRPLWLFRKETNSIEVIKTNKTAIGGWTQNDYPFTGIEIFAGTGDILYLFTDGYDDQFGGKDGKKFMQGKFRELLMSIIQKPMTEQKEILYKIYQNWKGDMEQVDDILVIGIRL